MTTVNTDREKTVISPNPLPVLPKICCSIGAELKIITTKLWIKRIKLSKPRIFKYLLLKIISLFKNITGNKNKVKENITINFGIIIASLLKNGVRISVFAIAPTIIILNRECFVLNFISKVYYNDLKELRIFLNR